MKKHFLKTTFCTVLLFSYNLHKAQTISTFTLNSASDDMEEVIGGNIDPGSSDLEFVTEPNLGQQIVGIRFNNISIANSSNILNAYIQFTVDEANTESTDLVIKTEASDNATTFGTVDKVSTRLVTTNSVNWSNIPTWHIADGSGLNQRTPNLSTIIQDVVNRPGWSSGNSIAFIISGTGKRVADAYEKSNALSLPYTTLHIEYGNNSTNIKNNYKAGKTISIFPNPANQTIQIMGVELNESVRIKIRSIEGKLIKDEIIMQSSFNISELKNGMYFIELTDKVGQIGVSKFIKN